MKIPSCDTACRYRNALNELESLVVYNSLGTYLTMSIQANAHCMTLSFVMITLAAHV